jgi:iron-sulfur cluster assembly accessory protein
MPNLITLTDAAAARVSHLLAKHTGDSPPLGLKIGVKTAGCSGLQYTMDYVHEVLPHDEVIEDKGVTVIVDPLATMYLVGTELDYVDDVLEPGFRFSNPNETSRCGCGESFTV